MSDTISRRTLLARVSAGAFAGAVGATWIARGQGEPPVAAAPKSWDDLRASFGLDPQWTHMAGLLLASHPAPVRAAIEAYRAKLDLNPVDTVHENQIKGEGDVRKHAAAYLNARAGDFALTDSTTMGLATLYNGIEIRSDQEFLTTTHDHNSTNQSLAFRSARSGAPVRRIALYEDASKANADEIVRRLKEALNSKTRVVAVTWVHSSTGVKLPIAAMAAAIQTANSGRELKDRILFCVDAVHGFGSQSLDLATFGADFIAAGCHKWLFGPRGTGVLWGRPEVQRQVKPTIPSFSTEMTWGMGMTPGGFHSFEHRWALGEAFKLHSALRKDRVQARINGLNTMAKTEMAKMKHVRLHTPLSEELSAGLICFEVEGMRPPVVVEKLRAKRIIGSTTPYATSYARITPGLINSEQDVESTLAALRSLG